MHKKWQDAILEGWWNGGMVEQFHGKNLIIYPRGCLICVKATACG